MARVFKEDMYILGLLNIYEVNSGIKVTLSENRLNNFYEVIEQNLEDMKSETNCLKSVIFSDNMDCYSISRGIGDKIFFTLNMDFEVLRTMIFRKSLLPIDVLYASMQDNALNCLGLQLKDGKISKKIKKDSDIDSKIMDKVTNDRTLYVRGGSGNSKNWDSKLVDELYKMMSNPTETVQEIGYGQEDEKIVTVYLDSHLEGGIKQKNLDLVLDLIDEYVGVKETIIKEEQKLVKKLGTNNKNY